jgi:hypothetical protein
MPTNWDIPPDPRFEPVTEIVSIHGSSEAEGAPNLLHSPLKGNFVRDALARGYRFGFIGSGDHHDGHPGAYQTTPPQGGLAAILAEERTREAVLAALRERRVYATNGPRILLRAGLGTHHMGSTIPAPPSGKLTEDLFVQVIAQAPLARVEIVRSGVLLGGELFENGELETMLKFQMADLEPGEYVYVRVVQENYGMAWSSPFYVVEPEADGG